MYNLELKLIDSKEMYEVAKDLVEKNHSYVPSFKSVGRRIDWLIYADGELIGMIGIGSSTYPPCKDILKYLNISKDDYKNIFNNIANNWRFCFSKSIPNCGTRVLKQMRKLAPIEWEKKYGDKLKYIITFVGGNHNGAMYKADNWGEIGFTSGLPTHKSVSMKWDDNSSIKQKFVKPNGENKKIIFIKKL